ncbi:MAG: type II secretion system F family protein [Candidatus Nealsonbacteria bacterium]|nr:type II secretion system F family protein [Candidatus Nealsonbacteria bacterium]
MRFNYQARTKTGEVQSGVVEASSREAAFTVLKTHGFFVTALEEAALPFYARRLKILERVSKKDIVLFSRQLSIMFKSKVPLLESFRTLAQQTKNSNFREKILKIAEETEGGTTLSKAFALYPKIFSPFYISMVKSGEASGRLSDVFLHLADHLEREHLFRSKIIGSLIYPAFILFVFIVIGVVILIFVLPNLTNILKESGQQLPLATRMVIFTSDVLKVWWWALLVAFFGLFIAIWRFGKTPTGKDFFDRTSMKIPFINTFLKKIYLARFALNLTTLISGGLPIAEALEITGEIVGNNVYKEAILETRDAVKKGEAISSVLERHPQIISPFFYQMVVVGEKTGTLDSSLTNVVGFYQSDVDRALEAFVKLLEPIFIIFLGIIVAIMVMAVLMPLYTIGLT